jgi:hypothetical protein
MTERCLVNEKDVRRARSSLGAAGTVPLALAASVAFFTLSSSANAGEVLTFDPGSNASYCIWASGSFSQAGGQPAGAGTTEGDGIFVNAYASGAGWDNGDCQGPPAPENTVAMEVTLFYQTNAGLELPCLQVSSCTGTGEQCQSASNNYQRNYNTFDFWGEYMAVLPNAKGILDNTYINYKQLCGDGFYMLEVDTWVDNPVNGASHWDYGAWFSGWQGVFIPNPSN